MKIIEINYIGRTANRVIQYMTAKSIAAKSDANINIFSKYGIPEFNIEPNPLNLDISNYKIINVTDNNIPFNELLFEINNNENIYINLNSYCQNLDNFKEFRNLFSDEIVPRNLNYKYGFGPEYILFHVRLAHVHHNSSVHPWYIPLPFNYYAEIIDSTGLIPVFVGEFSDDLYSVALKSKFSSAIFIESLDSDVIFSLFYNSTNVGIALSTFSWLATFLSKNIKQVFFPIFGLFDPLCYTTNSGLTNFIDLDDKRVVYHKLDKLIWSAKYDEVLSLIKDEYLIKKIDQTIADDLLRHLKVLVDNQK